MSKKKGGIGSAIVSFVFVFIFAFFLVGFFVRSHVPPIPQRDVSIVESWYWLTNWPGAIAGVVLGSLSATSILLKRHQD